MKLKDSFGYKEGFLIGGGLIFVGLLLEVSVGPVVWNAFAWPINGIALAGFLALIALIFILGYSQFSIFNSQFKKAFRFIGTYQAAIPAMVYAVLLTIIMGLTRQQVNGTWLNNMLSFWPFVLIYTYIVYIFAYTLLGVAAIIAIFGLIMKRFKEFMLIISFVLLQMCWWGINYLPSAQGSSVHTYSTY